MGAKYLPTKKDLKASARFEKTHLTQSKFIKPTTKPSAKKIPDQKNAETK